MRVVTIAILGALALATCALGRATRTSSASGAGPRDPARISPAALCVSAGEIEPIGDALFRVRHPGLRASVAGGEARAAELRFVYRGPTKRSLPLASGELRRQIGLKLRAEDTCNLVYVTWHVEPTPGVFVSVKRNPGAREHAQCGARGYVHVKPSAQREAPPLRPGEPHVLRAELEGESLRVLADGVPVWEGALPPEAHGLRGPAGVRTDNGEFDFSLHVPDHGGDARCAR